MLNAMKKLQILEKAKAKGITIKIKIDKKKQNISLNQELINASNLDKAEEILNELEKKADKKMMGAIWEKRGWVADYRQNYDDEIKFFKKAGEIYKTVPGATDIEGHKKDRILTVEHFIARALYFRGRKSDLKECEKLLKKNLLGYKKLKSEDAIAFNYSWLARTYIAMKDLKKAEKCTKKAEEFFDENMKAYTYRLKGELANAKGESEEAIRNAVESLRYTLPAGTYYNGVIEAMKVIIKAS